MDLGEQWTRSCNYCGTMVAVNERCNCNGTVTRIEMSKQELDYTGYLKGGKMNDVESTLDERGKTYGDYTVQSNTAQGIKLCMENTPKWAILSSPQAESLHLIATKISRILHGDPNHIDSWHDIAGYAQLVVQALEEK